ncbi:helix-turn-helix domain-containing protein [Flavobacterium rhizosphaerae]|uniref:Helix-turn-helix transcriptional regulator n=1 Tax=Flavobacterium rhizosphaerae TaxID=3163298 RepID=A0ABW8Z119_9FLAO
MNILRLKEILKEKGITGKELADKVGISETGMSNIVKGQSLPRQDILLQIAEILDVDIRELFNSTKEIPTETVYVFKDGAYQAIGSLKINN